VFFLEETMEATHYRISKSHPLRQLFDELVRRRFVRDVQISNSHLPSYVSGLLVEFTHVDSLHRIRDARGKHLEDVGEMLLESNLLLGASSFDREREVRKHIGDYTLFMTGLFPEHVASVRRTRGMRLESFVDFIKAGKESYRIVSSYDPHEYESKAPLFWQLADKFELCVYGLNLVKGDLERLQGNYYRDLERGLDL
jgi:hypothetical protein